MHYPLVASLANALTAAAVPVPVIGLPWPPASTVGSSRASLSTDSRAARLLQVVYHGGPERPGRRRNSPDQELSLRVTRASPVIRTRSPGRKYETWPGGVARCGDALPAWQAGDPGVWFERAGDLAEA
jgi:hypothetical protein